MTTSVLNAAIFSMLVWALPARDGLPIMKAPDPMVLEHDLDSVHKRDRGLDDDTGSDLDSGSCGGSEADADAADASSYGADDNASDTGLSGTTLTWMPKSGPRSRSRSRSKD